MTVFEVLYQKMNKDVCKDDEQIPNVLVKFPILLELECNPLLLHRDSFGTSRGFYQQFIKSQY